MRRRRATGRFYVFLVLLLIGGFFIVRELIPQTAREAIITLANASFTYDMSAVIIRDETVSAFEGTGRVVYLVDEGAAVQEGTPVCDVFSAGYSEKEMLKLETVRQNIRAYHEQILDNIVDTELESLENKVQAAALRLKTLIENKSGGSLLTLQKQLEEAMQARQDYLSKNRREDPKLNQLYEEEQKRVNNIASWKTTAKADRAGIVSFYLDGCESLLTPANLASLKVEDLRAILRGEKPESGVSRLQTPIFRVVSTDEWYVVLLSDDLAWNPMNGQVYTFQLDGYGGVAFSGTVTAVQKTAQEVVAQLKVAGSPGVLMNHRYGKASVGGNLSGLSVPIGAVVTQSGQTGVVLSDAAGGTFIPVDVLSTDSRYALVTPLVEGTLAVGQRVLLR